MERPISLARFRWFAREIVTFARRGGNGGGRKSANIRRAKTVEFPVCGTGRFPVARFNRVEVRLEVEAAGENSMEFPEPIRLAVSLKIPKKKSARDTEGGEKSP